MPRTIRVLHVDDDPELVALVAKYLEREREALAVTTETDPSAVLDRIHDERIDCVVSDYQMPRTNGLALLERVREEYPDVPFILFTGRGSEGVASSAISAGVTDYIQKGGTETYELLANRIEKAVDRQRAHREIERVQQGFRRLADDVDEAIVSVGEDGTVYYVNVALGQLLGRSREEIEGRSVGELVVESPLADDGTGRFRDGGPPADLRSLDLTAYHADGHELPVEVTYTTIDLGDRRIYAGIVQERDP